MGTYLGAIDLVTQNQLTIVARIGINPSDRLLGDVNPGLAIISVNNSSTTSRQVGSLVAAEFNVTKSLSVVDNMGGKSFSPGPSINFYSTPSNGGYASFNQQVGTSFGSLSLTATNFSSQLFNTPGTYQWTVPAGVTSISVAGVGGGGGGSQKSAGGSGGGGGLVSYSNSIAVTPGTTCTIIVGSGGATGGTYGLNGSSTYLLLPGTNVPIVIAQGGAGGDSIYWLSSSIGGSFTDATGVLTTQVAYNPAGAAITYGVSAGSLPTGASLNSSTGVLSWVGQSLSSDTEYTPFTLSATSNGQTITKQFTLKMLKLVQISLTYAVIAGGGPGGGYYYGGGGGAGGLLTNNGGSAFIIGSGYGTYTITVGSGGAGGTGALSNGNNSSISGTGLSVTTLGGGRGGNVYSTGNAATTGGSGGGSSSAGANSAAGTAGPPRQGYDGGAGSTYGGGGGGSGGNGTSGVGSSSPSGTGGVGTDLTAMISTTLATSSGVGYISGATVLFAGGGGGGEDANEGALTYQAPGSAGGGTGATYINGAVATDGQAYTGSGGGGACHLGTNTQNSGSGGKGVVILRYPATAALGTGGDVIDISGGYVTHIFKNSGTFVPSI